MQNQTAAQQHGGGGMTQHNNHHSTNKIIPFSSFQFLSFIYEIIFVFAHFSICISSFSQTDSLILLKPDRVFDGDDDIFKLMKEKGIAYCPTLAATEAIAQYRGWKKGTDPEPASVIQKRKSFQSALKSGVIICTGGDVGVFAHGDNAYEMQLMAEWGMKPLDVLRSATSVNANVFGFADKWGKIQKGLLADVIAVQGDSSTDINDIKKVIFVMKNGIIYKQFQ